MTPTPFMTSAMNAHRLELAAAGSWAAANADRLEPLVHLAALEAEGGGVKELLSI